MTRRNPDEVFPSYAVTLEDGTVKKGWYPLGGGNEVAVSLDGYCVFLSYEAQDAGWTKSDFSPALDHPRRVNASGRQVCCRMCHACLEPLRKVLDGEFWCGACQTYR